MAESNNSVQDTTGWGKMGKETAKRQEIVYKIKSNDDALHLQGKERDGGGGKEERGFEMLTFTESKTT